MTCQRLKILQFEYPDPDEGSTLPGEVLVRRPLQLSLKWVYNKEHSLNLRKTQEPQQQLTLLSIEWKSP